jgi:hypothetical protein
LDIPENDLTAQMTGQVRADNIHTLLLHMLHTAVAQRFAMLPDGGEKVDSIQQRMAGGGRGEMDRQEHGA